MKLIDLLVQELPKRGGWPEGVTRIVQDFDGEVKGLIRGASVDMYEGGIWRRSHGTAGNNYGVLPVAIDHATSIVTREQYEAALVAAQQPVWNGEGMPPVGCKCERECPSGRVTYRINYVSEKHIVYTMTSSGTEYSSPVGNYKFRPIRSEADKKRDEAIAALVNFKIGYHSYPKAAEEYLREVKALYDAIARGDIPHIHIEQAA
ncbi:hypothetical protein ACTEV4_000560 [Cronobacter turicensis]